LRLNVFDAAGHVDRPPVVSEVLAYLAHHGRHGERHEFGAVVGVEAVDGADEADACCLDEIVMWLAAAAVSPRNVVRQRQTAFDDCVALAPEGV
jgi:hypothetical protein